MRASNIDLLKGHRQIRVQYNLRHTLEEPELSNGRVLIQRSPLLSTYHSVVNRLYPIQNKKFKKILNCVLQPCFHELRVQQTYMSCF